MSLIRIQCLQERFIPFRELNISWKGDKRYPEQAIQRFIAFNREVFSFLGVTATLNEENYEKGLHLTASNFVGAAPLRLPATGKYYTDLQITSRFGENIPELVYLIQETFKPEYMDKELQHADNLRAPFYFDCINFFHSFLKAIHEPWNKFDATTRIERHPSSVTNWSRYAQRAIRPENMLKFENRKNILSRNHTEWQQLTYLLHVAIREFESFKTPAFIKQRYFSTLDLLKRYLNDHTRTMPLALFQIHAFEPAKIKELKTNANKLLEHNSANTKSWRIDSAELFERYVQYVLKRVGKISGTSILRNRRFPIGGHNRPSWTLKYLEPDIILRKNDALYFADAKYKAHMLQVHSSSDLLKEHFRADLHQILAYSSFDGSKEKTAFLIYPCNRFKNIRLEIANTVSNIHNQVFLIGLPFTTVGLDTFVNQLSDLLKTSSPN